MTQRPPLRDKDWRKLSSRISPDMEAEFDIAGISHLLSTKQRRLFSLPKKTLQRLLDAGADVNLRHRRFGSPLVVMYDAGLMANGRAGAKAEPLWGVLFERPDLDFDVPSARTARSSRWGTASSAPSTGAGASRCSENACLTTKRRSEVATR